MSFGTIHNVFGIHPYSSKLNRDGERLNQEIRNSIRKREKKQDSELDINLLDLMIKYNRSKPENERITEEEMVKNVSLFEVAGVDTTRSSTETFFKFFSDKPEYIKEIVEKEIPNMFKTEEDWYKYESYQKSNYIDLLLEEFMRVFGPAGETFPRVIVKDFKVGKYTLKKGDLIIIPMLGYHFNENNFNNPEKFDPSRFEEESKKSIKRNTYMPFYLGKRGCIGKYVAELILRMILTRFLREFEIASDGKEFIMISRFTYVTKDSTIMIKPRIAR